MNQPVTLDDFEALARERLSSMAWAYISGGAGDETTLADNRAAFARHRLWPRVLVDVSRVELGVRLLGDDLAHPILVAPTAYHRLAHPEGELATARGAVAARAPMVVSTLSTSPLEAIAAEVAGVVPLWFQLYVQPDRGFTRALVERARAAGFRALCLTVDTPVVGARDRETRAGFRLAEGLERPHLQRLPGLGQPGDHRPAEHEIYSPTLDPSLSWNDVEWLVAEAGMPVVLKGILHPDDAARALEVGAAAVVVSNHGGRNLDTVPATLDALPAITARVGGQLPLLLDGGVRRGTDVLKALALGASAVLVGRPVLYALAADGAAGVARGLEILRTELAMALALVGCPRLSDLGPGVVTPPR